MRVQYLPLAPFLPLRKWTLNPAVAAVDGVELELVFIEFV
jgi:hypothetical protein